MTPFAKKLLTLIFKLAVIVVIALICFFLVNYAAAMFAVPGQLANLINFLVFLYAAYRAIMLIIAFFE